MARVPTASGNLVERRVDPALLTETQDFGEGGRAIGQAVTNLGGTLGHVAQVQDQIDAHLDEAGAKQGDVKYSDFSRDALYSGGDAFYGKQGFNASDARAGVEKAIADKKEELLSSATTPRMRAMMAEALDRRSSQDLEGVARHATSQLKVENQRQSIARQATSADNAVTYADDPTLDETPSGADPYADYKMVDNVDRSKWDKRADGSDKGDGFLGLRRRPDGGVSSELSVGVEIDGKETDIPTMVPGLTKPEMDYLMTTPADEQAHSMPHSILDKAIHHAEARIADGLSPFKGKDEAGYSPATAGPPRQNSRFEQELLVGKSEVRNQAIEDGAGGDTIMRLEREYEDKVLGRVTKARIDRGDIEGASAWLEAHRGRLLPDTEASLDAALHGPILERQADGIVDSLMGIAPTSTDGQGIAAGVTSAKAGGPANLVSRMTSITAMSESGNRERDGRGRLITSTAGAQGQMQVMPGTNLDPGFGVRSAKDGTDGERTRVGRDYLNAMMRRYGGDPSKAWGAYNWGPGRVDAALKQHGGNWLAFAPAETQAYVRGNLAALGGRGSAVAVQQAPREHDLGALLDNVDKLNLPFDLEQKVRRQLTERVGTDESLLRRQQSQAEEQATTILDNAEAQGGKVTRDTQIPQAVWDGMSAASRMTLRGVIDRNAKPENRVTDFTVYAGLSEMYARDPAGFTKLNPLQFRNSLSNEDFKQMITWRRDALGGGKGPEQVTHSRISGIVSDAMTGAGITTQGLRTRDTAGHQAVARRQYQLETAIAKDVEILQRTRPEKPVTDLEIQQIADRQLIRWKPAGGEFDDDAPQYWFERSAKSGQIVMPRGDYNRIKAQGRRTLGRWPTDEEIAQVFRREARGGR